MAGDAPKCQPAARDIRHVRTLVLTEQIQYSLHPSDSNHPTGPLKPTYDCIVHKYTHLRQTPERRSDSLVEGTHFEQMDRRAVQ